MNVTNGLDPAGTASAAPAGFPPLSVFHKIGYGIAAFAEGAHNAAVTGFLFFYLTAVCGMPGALAGLALFVSLTVDAVVDPAIGHISDRMRSRWGRRHPFLFGGVLPWALALALLFSTPTWLEGAPLFAWTAGLLILLRVSISVIMLPHAALGAEVARGYRERAVLGSYRAVFQIAGQLITSWLGFAVFMASSRALLERSAYIGFGWTIAALGTVAILATAFSTLGLRARLHVVDIAGTQHLASFVAGLRECLANRSFRILFGTLLVFWAADGVTLALLLHVNRFFWNLPTGVMATLPVFGSIGSGLGIAATALLLRRLGKHQICAGAIVVICAAQALPISLRALGLFPAGGAALHAALCLAAAVVAFALMAAIITFNAMVADATDEHEHIYGSRREGLYFSAVSLSNKAALGFGALVAGFTLEIVGFPREMAGLENGEGVPWGVARDLALIAGPGAGVLALSSTLIIARYRLGATQLQAIQAELVKRRAR